MQSRSIYPNLNPPSLFLPFIGCLVNALTIPLTMKFRAGWNDQELVMVDMARIAEVNLVNGRVASSTWGWEATGPFNPAVSSPGEIKRAAAAPIQER